MWGGIMASYLAVPTIFIYFLVKVVQLTSHKFYVPISGLQSYLKSAHRFIHRFKDFLV